MFSSPCIGPDGTVYGGSNDHKLYAIKEGKRVWDFETNSGVASSPCIGPDGTVYVGSLDGALYELSFSKDRLLQQSESEPDKVKTETSLETDDEWLTIDGVWLRINPVS